MQQCALLGDICRDINSLYHIISHMKFYVTTCRMYCHNIPNLQNRRLHQAPPSLHTNAFIYNNPLLMLTSCLEAVADSKLFLRRAAVRCCHSRRDSIGSWASILRTFFLMVGMLQVSMMIGCSCNMIG